MPHVPKDVFATVIKAYLASPNFRRLAEGTQKSYQRHLRMAEHPDCLGSVPVDAMRPALVQAFLDGLADRTGTQQNARTALKALEAWALVRDLLPGTITLGTEVVGSRGGHTPWSDDNVAFAEMHGAPHLARVVTMAANVGQRGSDLCKMRWTDIETIRDRPGINVRQKKTGLEIWVPFTAELIERMTKWDRSLGFILTKPDGQPYANRNQLTDAWDRERRRAELRPLQDLVLHGLRGTAVVRLRRTGASISEICSMVGLSPGMVERYCRFSVQKENALAAVERLDAARGPAKVLKFHKP